MDQLIEFMEGESFSTDKMEALPMLEASFMKCSPKDRVLLYLSAKEYKKPKMQRTSILDDDSTLPDDIYKPNEL
jgi:hypothetical protein